MRLKNNSTKAQTKQYQFHTQLNLFTGYTA